MRRAKYLEAPRVFSVHEADPAGWFAGLRAAGFVPALNAHSGANP